MTSEEIVEMMAYERLEPFGALAQEFRSGMLCAVVANVHRDPKRDAFTPRDFSPVLDSLLPKPDPVLLDDPEAQSRLIKERIFGMKSERDDG